MVAAIVASWAGANVTIVEQLPRLGRKILATGNGRCNLSNVDMNIKHYHGSDIRFAEKVLARFGYNDSLDFFGDLGLNFFEEDGRMYPASMQASSVLDVLRYEMKLLGVKEICDTTIMGIKKDKAGFSLILKDKSTIYGDKVIIATGGKANPGLGSKGQGYSLAKTFGHRIVNPFPALVQLRLDAPYLKAISGVRFSGKASVKVNNKIIKEEIGEMLFTNYGISGIPVLQLSRHIGEQLNLNKKAYFYLDLFPQLREEELLFLLKKRCKLRLEKPLDQSFIGLINKRLINVLLKEAKISSVSISCNKVTDKDIAKIAGILKSWSFDILGTRSWSEAQVTAGGIDVSDVNPETMESKIVPGLYFAGEVLDIDGDCGGYNLQWAWSTGYLAGKNAAKSG